jgi:hypothetical protein
VDRAFAQAEAVGGARKAPRLDLDLDLDLTLAMASSGDWRMGGAHLEREKAPLPTVDQ